MKSFEEKYKVKVKVVEMQMTDQVKKLRLDGPAGTGPDVVTLPHDQIGNAVTEGLLSEVKADDAVKSKFTDSSIAHRHITENYMVYQKQLRHQSLFTIKINAKSTRNDGRAV